MATTPTAGPANGSGQDLTATARRAARARRERLHHALVGLEEALTSPSRRPDVWLTRVRGAIEEMRVTVLDHVTESEGPDGLLAQITEASSWLGPRVEQLRAEHDHLVSAADQLAASAADATDPDEVGDAAWTLLEQVSRHRRRGADLLYDAYALDVAAGD